MKLACVHSRPSVSGQGVNEAIDAARALCAAAGGTLTEPRRRALELLVLAGRPVKAYEMADDFRPDRSKVYPATIYRALDFLVELGLAHRIESLNAFVFCPGPHGPHRPAFLICDCCGSAVEVRDVSLLAEAAPHLGFRLTGATMELRGLCRGCAG